MTNVAHIVETGLLLLAAYLLGCIVGYAARRILHAARGTRQVGAVAEIAIAVPPEVRRPRSAAVRLAASVEDVPLAAPVPVSRPIAGPSKRAAPPPEKVTAVAGKPPVKPRGKGKPADPKPATLASPRSGGADNLKQIKGIGPKIEASLHAIGIFHIDQIAGWSKANVDWVEAQLAFKGRIRRERWVEQAMDLDKVRVSA
ncbi:hypothetical protein [Devosia sp. Root635]|uniref:hypothetical protein n=1 Tax=Devosia sp. Root635 TaxID=1736575 RepID=UPI0006FE8A11|nr:hypothetical protein [Devosia sp. Root635]KRA51453.1 hypothetical protein ASD80_14780 [Devosia sp. Root635]